MRATRYRLERTLVLDAGPALACFAVGPLALILDGTSQNSPLVTTGLGVGLVAPLLVRRRLPLLALLGVAAVLAFFESYGVLVTTFVSNAGPTLAVAVYTLAARWERRPALYWIGGVSLVLAVITRLAVRTAPAIDHDAVQLVAAAVGLVIGDVVRARRADRSELVRQRRRQAEEREARVRAEERLRLSRDVHDVVSHTLSMIAVRSGVARVTAADDPGAGLTALADIEAASRTALEELRTVLRQTRSGDDGPAEPGLDDLPRLAETCRAAGPDVHLEVTARRFAPVVETSVYRIVQESLTNVVKHADAAHVAVVVSAEVSSLTVQVTDDGRGRAAGVPDGIGTAGMRERVSLLDGKLRTGPGPHGGHELVAVIPIGG